MKITKKETVKILTDCEKIIKGYYRIDARLTAIEQYLVDNNLNNNCTISNISMGSGGRGQIKHKVRDRKIYLQLSSGYGRYNYADTLVISYE